MNVINLTKKLVSIPSYIDGQTDEKEIGKFIYDYLKEFGWLKVSKQLVTNGRFNIIAKDKYPTKLLFIGHMDTVQPRQGWKTEPLSPVIKNSKIYGLGATDMKNGLAAILSALQKLEKTRGLMLLFYIDEEYNFLGSKKFISEFEGKIEPKLIISADGSDLKIGTGCRGLIEIKFTIKGKGGHAARPKSGKNAIDWSLTAINSLKKYLEKFSTEELGKTSINTAFFQGGLNLGQDKNNQLILGQEGNNIADVAEFIVDIRPASLDLNATKVIKKVKSFLNINGLKLISKRVKHDLSPWLTKKSEIKKIAEIIKKQTPIKYSFPNDTGFIDVQMFWKTFNKVPCLTFGAGKGKLAHKPNEFAKIKNLLKTEQVFQKIIEEIC